MPPLVPFAIRDPKRIFEELATFLSQYKDTPVGSNLFVVEGTIKNPEVALRYPGRKMVRRVPNGTRTANFIEWANLLDFEVVAFDEAGAEVPKNQFSYNALLKDFDLHKKQSPEFWDRLNDIYSQNALTKTPPDLPGIPSRRFLGMLKWMWIQEDLNYKYHWKETSSPVPYVLQTVRGRQTRKGAGRGKFYGALYLLYHGVFDRATVTKVVSPR